MERAKRPPSLFNLVFQVLLLTQLKSSRETDHGECSPYQASRRGTQHEDSRSMRTHVWALVADLHQSVPVSLSTHLLSTDWSCCFSLWRLMSFLVFTDNAATAKHLRRETRNFISNVSNKMTTDSSCQQLDVQTATIHLTCPSVNLNPLQQSLSFSIDIPLTTVTLNLSNSSRFWIRIWSVQKL